MRQYAHQFLYRGYRDISWVLIQDESRKRLFQASFPLIPTPQYALIPNSYINEIEPVAEAVSWFDELRRASRRLVTYTGAIERWAISLEFMTVVKQRKDISFLFSGWSQDGFAEELMHDCHGQSHIHFDLGKKSRSELNHIVSNSDMGLIFYDSSDPNVSEIGLSSGKLHKFLSYNKPVLANYMPGLERFLGAHGFGLSVAPAAMGDAIDTILGNLDDYGMRIRAAYPNMCDFRNAYGNFLDQVQLPK